ncbi:thiolase [Dactylosporangium sp. AC04546]|uniref:thiolase C-terminal domain-containing protein n=1 Tax=Dactylosporangium sp. AC04546 TaxID=2862460 RepID=UPI001EDD4FD1|nr:thiolase [Dactylosporangium sp. AC04546]WVK81454.1 thiolase [Dactylosporangium sp. AC04546]
MTTGVSIAGAAESDLGVTGKTALHLQAQAVTRALADAGLRLSDVDGLATNGVSRFAAAQVAEYLGLRPRWTDSTFAGGSAFQLYVGHAAQAIRAGQASVVVISYGSNQRTARSRTHDPYEPQTPEAQFERPYGPLYPVSAYALAAQRYLHVYGAARGRAALSAVAVNAREWALENPRAYRYGAGPLTAADVEGSPLVSDPLTTADCCLVTDGGGAVVLVSAERARDLPGAAVPVLGYGEATTGTSIAGLGDLLHTGAAESGRRAFAMAGLTPADVDAAQVYDSFTITVLLSLEALGFCAPGEAPDFLATGGLPLNTSGGGLSYCHPGQLGVLLLVEAVRRLRATADRVALVHGTGGILSTHGTVLLGAPS